jgi:hypothetical protein
MDTSVFYPADRERGPRLARRERRAKQICGQCPVVTDCLSWALAAREPFGVWGGMSEKERARLLAGRDRRGESGGARSGPPGDDGREAEHVGRVSEIRQRDEHGSDSSFGEQPISAEMFSGGAGVVAPSEDGRRRSAS